MLFIVSVAGNHVLAQLTEIDPKDDNEPRQTESVEKDKDKKDSRFVYGGFMAAGFGNYTTINLSPVVGYRVTDKFTPGIGFTWQYAQYKDADNMVYNPFADYKFNTLGGRVFMQYSILYGVFAHAEYEQLWYNFEFLESPYLQINDQQPGLFLGGGYRFGAGNSAGLQILALWNALWDTDNLIYPNPWTLRFSVMF
ncbi:MAG TPA: hypothetical protein DCG24_09425 [Bacteroidetes bacterium]|nr:hypothetical protein [Bacteroidota bacterium]